MRGLGGLAQLLLGALAIGTLILPGTLTASPVETIRNAEMLLVPAVLIVYSLLVESCSFWRALGRALASIPLGAAVVAFFAITLGAPIGFHADTARRTLYWSLFMSTLMIAPASALLGTSWSDWQRIFAFTRPKGNLELSICLSAHGAAIGAWLGAFPMPLDWDREWQRWPVSCTYGAVSGYFLSSLASFIWFRLAPRPPKVD